MRYHIIWSTKHRSAWLGDSEVEALAYKTLRERSDELGTFILEADGFVDHVHVVIGIPPTLAVSTVVGQLKSASSKAVRKKFPELNFRWQKGFAGLTLCAWDFEDVCFYVRHQKQRHREGRVKDHLETLNPEDYAEQAPKAHEW